MAHPNTRDRNQQWGEPQGRVAGPLAATHIVVDTGGRLAEALPRIQGHVAQPALHLGVGVGQDHFVRVGVVARRRFHGAAHCHALSPRNGVA